MLELKPIFRRQLEQIYDQKEAQNLVNLLIEHFLGMTKIEQALKPDFRLSESELLDLHFAMKRLLKSEPIQYLLGETVFCGLKFEVNSSVLIPRPETEELVDLIIRSKVENKKIIDIGTGSGCIAITLQKKLNNCNITGIDISEKALDTAKRNATIHKSNVNFIKTDIREPNQQNQLDFYDVIVSNPPYVTHQEKKLMDKNVLDWEPFKALFTPEEDPLFFYIKILEFSKKHLMKEGSIFFEINENYGQALIKLVERYSFEEIKLHQDFRGKDRILQATKKSQG